MTGGRLERTIPESGSGFAPRTAVPVGIGGAAMTAMRYSQISAGLRPPIPADELGPSGPHWFVNPIYVRDVEPTRVVVNVEATVTSASITPQSPTNGVTCGEIVYATNACVSAPTDDVARRCGFRHIAVESVAVWTG